jgi:hypothetical protein
MFEYTLQDLGGEIQQLRRCGHRGESGVFWLTRAHTVERRGRLSATQQQEQKLCVRQSRVRC